MAKATYQDTRRGATSKGKTFVNHQGYVVHKGENGKMTYDHRDKTEKRLGRKLKKSEDVNHGKKGKKNNGKKNLKVEDHKKHMKEHGMAKGMENGNR